MKTKTIDNTRPEESDNLPVLATPHFDEHEIAQAKPVQPLAAPERQRRSAPGLRMIGLGAASAGSIVLTVALATAFINANPLLRPPSYGAAAPNQVSKEPTSSSSLELNEKTRNEAPPSSERRKFSIRRSEENPRTLFRFGSDDTRQPKARLVTVIK